MNKTLQLSVLAAALMFAAGAAHAGTVIINPASTVALGVNDDGSLNTQPNITANASATGLAYNFGTAAAPVWRDATAPAVSAKAGGCRSTARPAATRT